VNSPPRILVIDDNAHLRRILLRILKAAHYDVSGAATGVAGLELARQLRPDLVLLDVVLPDVTGFTVCRQIKRELATHRIHVVLISSLETTSQAQAEGLEAGADGYITRPLSNQEMLARVAAALRCKTVEDQLAQKQEKLEQRVHEQMAQLEATNRALEQEIREHHKTEVALRATLDATPDGILVVDNEQQIAHTNLRFAELWHIPSKLMANRDDNKLLQYAREQLEDPEAFLAKVKELYQTAREDFDVLRFKDGRIFDRFTCPLRDDQKIMGRVWCFRDITERKHAEEALLHERHLLHALMENIPDRVYFKDTNSRFTRISHSHTASLGLNDPQAAIGKTDADFKPCEFAQQTRAEEQKIIETGEPLLAKVEQAVKSDGRVQWTSAAKVPIKDQTGRVVGIVGISRDITREIEIQQQIQQVHKLEAVGRLAGGIAHDFNNILQIIGGFTEIMLESTAETDQLHHDLLEIQKAAKRAADLTSQLLAFGRKQMILPRALDLNLVIHKTENMLRRLLGEDIQINTQLDPDLARVKMDPGQLDQIIVDLTVNARDAMPDGGRVTLSTANVIFKDADLATHPKARLGHFVRLSVADTSAGMSMDVIAHIFEPFFSTKVQGRGTGLGLAVIYGIAEQSNGWISVHSHVGQGSTFDVYLPAYHAEQIDSPQAPTHVREPAPITPPSQGKRILLTEDEPGVRNVALQVLRKNGYDVVATESVQEALAMFEREGGRFDLLFSDVVLPDGNGVDLASKLKLLKPGLPILLCSGYTDERSRWNTISETGFHFLQKPYHTTALLNTVHQVFTAHP